MSRIVLGEWSARFQIMINRDRQPGDHGCRLQLFLLFLMIDISTTVVQQTLLLVLSLPGSYE